MKPTLLILLAFFIAKTSFSQNLVPNPGFEYTVKCPDYISELDYAVGWHTLVNTPDYYNVCNNTSFVNAGMVGVPNSARGYQYPHTGVAYAGEVNYYTAQTDYRETFYAQLLSPLAAGVSYDVGMWVVMQEDHAKWAVDGDLGIYLSNAMPSSSSIFTYSPQVKNPHGNVLNDSLNWTKISGTYTAVGGEQYITIGSFIRDSQLTIIDRGGSYSFTSYGIDDVWVLPADSMVTTVEDNSSITTDVFPNPTNGEITVSAGWKEKKNATVELLNVMGEKIITLQKQNENSFSEKISLADFPAGIYFLSIQTNNAAVIRKIVLMK